MTILYKLVHDAWLTGRKIKTSFKGWLIGNAVCCHHKGHAQDKRMRGNMMFAPDGKIAYNCYNCGTKAIFNGIELTKNFENLMHWLSISHADIQQAKLELLKNKIDGVVPQPIESIISFTKHFKEISLPADAATIESITEWEDVPVVYLKVLEYLQSRGSAVADNHDYYWSPSTKHDMNNRIIIPFYYDHQIVGWTARYAGKPPAGVPRYYNSELQTGYLFNNEVLDKPTRKYALLVEGPFDAIAIDGVAALGSELSKEQLAWLLQCGKEIVVVPDRQRKNQGLIDAALVNGWAVSFPDWEEGIKDCADASARYGRIYTLRSILESKTTSTLQINVKRQMFKG